MESGNEPFCLDVGGTKYKVSRTLIERHPQTMLARLVSDTWLQDPTKEVFIDRDGDRFRLVLDYMRDGKACLPMNIPKPSMMQELDYFGFDNVPSGAINESYSIGAAATRIAELQKSRESDEKARSIEKLALEKEIGYETLAHECFMHYVTTGDLVLNLQWNSTECKGEKIKCILDHYWNDACFNTHLSKLGLRWGSGRFYNHRSDNSLFIFEGKLEALGTGDR